MSFLLEATRAHNEAVIAGDAPRRWEMTLAGYRQLLRDLEIDDGPKVSAVIGASAPRPLLGLSIDIVAGPRKEFRLITESGAEYAEGGAWIAPAGAAGAHGPARRFEPYPSED